MKSKIDWTKPVRFITTPQLPCRVICVDRKGKNLPVMVLVDQGHYESTYYCREDGLSPGMGWFENVPESEVKS